MLAVSLFALGFATAASVVALPASLPGPWCQNLGGGAFDKVANFTLAAWNATGTNSNNTGVPLVFGQAGAIDGAAFKVLSTSATWPYNDYPFMQLAEGRVIPHGNRVVPAMPMVVEAGHEVAFIASNFVDPSQGPQIFCAVANTDPAGGSTGFPILAVNGDTDSFSLCKAAKQNNVVYKPAPANKTYDFASCYPVKVQLIFEF